jgi:hypothetical protein
MKADFFTAWPSPDAALREEVVAFWRAEGALTDPAQARERALELLLVARDESGRIVAVSTARRSHIELLGLDCYYLRMFVGRAARSLELAGPLLHEAYLALHAHVRQGLAPGVAGVFLEIENRKFQKVIREAVWTWRGMSFVYLGRNPRGSHLRVCYFPGARLPDEAPAPAG